MAESRDFGTLINERRLALGYSLGQLANRVRATASDVRAWERGQRAPNAALVGRLAKELELDPGELSAAAERVRSAGKAAASAADGATAVIAATVFSDAADTASVDPEEEEQVVAEAREERPTKSEGEEHPERGRDQLPADPGDEPAAAKAPADVAAAEPIAERPSSEDPRDSAEPSTALVAAAAGPADGDEVADAPVTERPETAEPSTTERVLTDVPTEAVPVVPTAAAGPSAEPVATVLAPSRPTAPAAPQQRSAPTAFEPFTSFLRTLYDPERRYLFWIRTALIVIVMLVFLRILASAVPAFFDTIGEILDTIESTPTDTTLIPGG